MAGMGEALGLMIAGGVGNAAGQRSADLREAEKAQIAADREKKLEQFKAGLKAQQAATEHGYNLEQDAANNEARAKEGQADRDSRMSIAQLQEAGANSRNAASNASAERRSADEKDGGVDPVTGKRMQGSPKFITDPNTGQTVQIVTFRGGESEVRPITELPGGDKIRNADTMALDADADTYATNRIKEMKGGVMGFGGKKNEEAFKDYGGSEEKARIALQQEFRTLKGGKPQAAAQPEAANVEQPVKSQSEQPKAEAPKAEKSGGDITASMNDVQKDLFNQARAAVPDASDEQLLQALVSDPRYQAYFLNKK